MALEKSIAELRAKYMVLEAENSALRAKNGSLTISLAEAHRERSKSENLVDDLQKVGVVLGE